MEIMAREKWGLLAVSNTATCTADVGVPGGMCKTS